MTKVFRVVALLEGVSYILLLFLAVPIKYWGGDEQWVKLLGMPHGILFFGYIAIAFSLKSSKKWSFRDLLIILICSIFPFGTFYVDWKYLK
tara:strand:+ start:1607 stop:1879 length:273 start_codon:yes stop_codon:yes gene_type:complete